jgi:hypothetical protein
MERLGREEGHRFAIRTDGPSSRDPAQVASALMNMPESVGWSVSTRRFIPEFRSFRGYRFHYPAGLESFFLARRSLFKSKDVFQLRTSCISHSTGERDERRQQPEAEV